jgi:thioredoxin-related protein
VKRLLIACLVAFPVLPVPAAQENLLETPLEEVLNEAATQNRHLYIAFLGKEWSVACKRFKASILDSAEFQDFADTHLLYCPVAGGRMGSRAKEEAARLQSLVIHFNIMRYPTILLLSPDGSELLRHGYREDSAEAYVSLLKAILPPDMKAQAEENGS